MKLYWNQTGLMYTWENVDSGKSPNIYLGLLKTIGPWVRVGLCTWWRAGPGGPSDSESPSLPHPGPLEVMCLQKSKLHRYLVHSWRSDMLNSGPRWPGNVPESRTALRSAGDDRPGKASVGLPPVLQFTSGHLIGHQGAASSPAFWGLRTPCAWRPEQSLHAGTPGYPQPVSRGQPGPLRWGWGRLPNYHRPHGNVPSDLIQYALLEPPSSVQALLVHSLILKSFPGSLVTSPISPDVP